MTSFSFYLFYLPYCLSIHWLDSKNKRTLECSLPIRWTRILSEICILRFSRGLVKRNFALEAPFKPSSPDPDAILNKLAVTRDPEEPSLASHCHSPLDPRVTDLIFRLLSLFLSLSPFRGLFNYVKWYRLLNFNRVKSFMGSVIARDRWAIIGWKRVIGKKGSRKSYVPFTEAYVKFVVKNLE